MGAKISKQFGLINVPRPGKAKVVVLAGVQGGAKKSGTLHVLSNKKSQIHEIAKSPIQEIKESQNCHFLCWRSIA